MLNFTDKQSVFNVLQIITLICITYYLTSSLLYLTSYIQVHPFSSSSYIRSMFCVILIFLRYWRLAIWPSLWWCWSWRNPISCSSCLLAFTHSKDIFNPIPSFLASPSYNVLNIALLFAIQIIYNQHYLIINYLLLIVLIFSACSSNLFFSISLSIFISCNSKFVMLVNTF